MIWRSLAALSLREYKTGYDLPSVLIFGDENHVYLALDASFAPFGPGSRRNLGRNYPGYCPGAADSHAIDRNKQVMSTPLGLLLQNMVWAGVVAFGSAVLFNVPVRTLPACVLSGAIAHVVRTTLVESGLLTIDAYRRALLE